jgi:hypothetical protein
VSPSELEVFASEVLLDQKMAALALEAGKKLSVQTVIQLGAETEAIYMLTSLQGRGLDLIKQHHDLCQQTAEFFQDAVAIWQAVPTNGELLDIHRQLLAQLCELARDRVEFYTVSESERLDYRRKLDWSCL